MLAGGVSRYESILLLSVSGAVLPHAFSSWVSAASRGGGLHVGAEMSLKAEQTIEAGVAKDPSLGSGVNAIISGALRCAKTTFCSLNFHSLEIVAACSALFALYSFHYVGLLFRPSTSDPLSGWWGWSDQGEYLRSAQALLRLDFSPVLHIYPPLYSMTAAIFLPAFPVHPFFVVDAMLLLTFGAVLVHIGSRIYGRLISWSTLIVTFWCFLPITLLQWEIPWTSSLTAGLVSILFAVFFRFSTKRRPWSIERLRDWGCLIGFYIAHGAILATRPLDAAPLLPMAVILYIKVVLTKIADAESKGLKAALASSCAVVAAGLLFPAAYLLFNFLVFGDAFGGYISLAASRGYYPANLLQKTVALLFDGSAIYLEKGTALADQFWPALFALPVVIVSLARAPIFIRVVSLSILLHICIYMPFRDLFPVTLFRFMNVHYFKWVLPWLTLIAAGQIFTWLKAIWRGTGTPLELAATAVLFLIAHNIGFTFPNFELISDQRNGTSKILAASLREPRWFDVMDVSHLASDLSPTLYAVEIDGRHLLSREFLLVPAPWGSRVVFVHPKFGQRIRLKFDPSVAGLENGTGTSRVGSYQYTIRCHLLECPATFDAGEPKQDKPAQDKFRISFAKGGDAERLLETGWARPEEWGRWTNDDQAALVIPPQGKKFAKIEVVVKPLISNLRRNQQVFITVNRCLAVRARLTFPDNEGLTDLSAPLPSECTESGQPTRITITTDHRASPSEVWNSNYDQRRLGIEMISLSLN